MTTINPKNVEFSISDKDLMVTKTDLNGILTYANEDFVRTSGYNSESELLGKSHSVIHHPDMPDEVFADLWNSLKVQRPWTGLIKNLRTDGRYFWVLANITPDYENGVQVGYMAVRSKPTKEQIEKAENAYEIFKSGKFTNLAIKNGDIFKKDAIHFFDFFKNITIKKRISLFIIIVFSIIVITSSLGLQGMMQSNKHLNSVYVDRVVPMYQIGKIQHLITLNRVLITAALANPAPDIISNNTTKVEHNIEQVNKLWKNYKETYLTEEEKVLAQQFEKVRGEFVLDGLKPTIQALRTNSLEKANELIVTKVRPLYEPTNEYIQKLLQLQMDVTEQTYYLAQSDYNTKFRWVMILGIIGLVTAVMTGLMLYRAIIRPLYVAADMIMRGDNKNLVSSNNNNRDEISKVLDAFKTSQVKNSFNAAEAKRTADKNLRIKIGLDNVGRSVMIADDENNIIYLNTSAKKMFKAVEANFRKQFPDFDSSQLIGQNIDRFHKNPEFQKEIIKTLSETTRSKVIIGGRTMIVTASPVVNDNGERLGTIAEWHDRTEEVEIEKEVADVVGAIAQGDFSQRIDEQGKTGFILLISGEINQLVSTCSDSLNEIVYVLSALSQGDLTKKVTKNYSGIFGQLKNDANETVENLKQIVGQIQEVANTINIGTKEIAAGNNDLSHRTEKQAASLEETASSMEELTSIVRHNTDNAQQANELALKATGTVRHGLEVVNEVADTMQQINTASMRIADITSVIDDIAFQTNILALNAAVEAARAGEQGKGFAVVATEVRNLAQRAAVAAGQIKTLIDDSVNKVSGGTQLVAKAGGTMTDIVESIQKVTIVMSEIASASVEQSQGIEQVNKAVRQMDEVTQQNAALVEQSAAAAETLEEQARNLLISVRHFRLASNPH